MIMLKELLLKMPCNILISMMLKRKSKLKSQNKINNEQHLCELKLTIIQLIIPSSYLLSCILEYIYKDIL